MTDSTGQGREPIVFERIPYDPVTWDEILSRYPGAEIYHSAGWLAFLASSQAAEPVVAVVTVAGRPVGHFVGATVRRYGIKILGSPLRGWGTQCMGFLLEDGVDRVAVAEALRTFAFGTLGCLHIELADRALTEAMMVGTGYRVEVGHTFVIDLRRSEEEILAGMRPKTRQYIRKATRDGLHVEVASDRGFADDFHAQLTEVFARQGLLPTYDVDRVRCLIDTVQPTGQVLLLRVRTSDGRIVGTGIAIGRNRLAVNWGAAWFRADADLHPIQLFWWEAIRYWRARGVDLYDMGGAGDYKIRYGGVMTPTAHFYSSRFGWLQHGRTAVRRLMKTRQLVPSAAGRRARRRTAKQPDLGDGG